MIERKTILVLDEPHIIKMVRRIAEGLGCSMVGVSKADFIEEVIQRNQIAVLVLAKEMRIKGPSLTELLKEQKLGLTDAYLKLRDTEIDFEFGINLLTRLRLNGIKLPIIFMTTQDLKEPEWHVNKQGKIYHASIPKFYGGFEESMRFAISECLNRATHSEAEGI